MVFSIPVLEEHGLEICWKNDAPAGNFTKCLSSEGSDITVPGNEYCFDCEKYDIPSWLDGFVTFLWVLFAIDIFIAFYWMTFMWNNTQCRESIFKFADNRDSNVKAGPGKKIRNCCCLAITVPKDKFCCCCAKPLDKAEESGKKGYKCFKKVFCLPDGKRTAEENKTYNYWNDVVKGKIEEGDVIFGHKAFYWPPNWPKFTLGEKKRIAFSLTFQYAPILALLLDFYFDIEYLNQISLYTSRNIMDKHIQINNGALIVVAIWDIFSFFTIPLTCMIVFQMSFTPNLKKNLIGEVVLLNISYLLEDGVELMLQYYFFDKYAGVKYDYAAQQKFWVVIMSAFISFTLAVCNIFILSHLFHQLNTAKKNNPEKEIKGTQWCFLVFLFCLGLVPLLAMFFRVIASSYQIFTFRKYRTGCLHYELPDQSSKIASVIQAKFFDFNCWRAIDYPLIFGNFLGIFLHFCMACYLAVEAICGVPNDVKIVEPDLNYEIEELAIPKAQPEREMSPDETSELNSKQDSVSNCSDSFDSASPSSPPPPAQAPKCAKSQAAAQEKQAPVTSQPQKATVSVEPIYQEPPKPVQKEKKPARQPPAPPQKSINAAVDI